MREILQKKIEAILVGFGLKDPKVVFDYPARMDFGDLSTNVSLAYAKELGKKPLDLAEEITHHLVTALPSVKIEVAPPGFINFFFDKEYFAGNVKEIILKKDSYGKNDNLEGQKIIIEYTDPNPFKEFHIGHLMPNVIGESISRIIEVNGAEIKRACYQGDIGMHVSTAIWGIMDLGIDIEDANVQDLGKAYAHGSAKSKEDENAKQEIVEINSWIFSHTNEKIDNLFYKGRKISLDYFETIYKKLDTQFDFYFLESEVSDFAKQIVLEFMKKGVFEESDGAVVFKGEKYNPKLHTRVFLNSQGFPVYEAKELGLSKIKYEKYAYDKSIIVTGNEINEYFKVLLEAMRQVFPDLAKKTLHVSHGMLRLPESKMSSRTGNVITAESLIGQVKEKVLQKIKDREFSDSEREEIAEIVAIGAIKYSILRQAIGGDIIFDFDKSISFEGDSGPYLQYATVRAKSVLQKAGEIPHLVTALPSDWQTTNLERLLERFPSTVERAGVEYAPHYIVTYLIELAGEFNSFYASHKIIPARPDAHLNDIVGQNSGRSGGDETDSTSPYRLALTQAFVFVMTSGLDLLGIKVPDKM